MNARDVCLRALDTWGPAAQKMVLFEELGELMQAIVKYDRARAVESEDVADRLANIAEEIADVKIMLFQMELHYGVEEAVDGFVDGKLARLAGRLDKVMEVLGHDQQPA